MESKRIVIFTALDRIPETCSECRYKYHAFVGTECYFTQKSNPSSYED